MDSPIAKKLGIGNLGSVYGQTNNVTIHNGQQVALIYSDPLPDLSAFQGRGDEINQLKTGLSDDSTSIIGILG